MTIRHRGCMAFALLSLAGQVAYGHQSFDEPIARDPNTGHLWFLQGWISYGQLGCEGYNLRLVEYDSRGYERAILPLAMFPGAMPSHTSRHFRTWDECLVVVPEYVTAQPLASKDPRDSVREQRPHSRLVYNLDEMKCSPNGLQAVVEGFVPTDLLTAPELVGLYDDPRDSGFRATRVKIQHPAGGLQMVDYFGFVLGNHALGRNVVRLTWTDNYLFATWQFRSGNGNFPEYGSTTEVIRLKSACNVPYGDEPTSCKLQLGRLNQAALEIGVQNPDRRVPPRCSRQCRYCARHEDPLHKDGACIECRKTADCDGGKVCASDGTCRSLKDTSTSSLRFNVTLGATAEFHASPSVSAPLVIRPVPDCLKHLGITVFDEGVEWWFVDLGGTRAWVDMRTLDLVSTDGSCAKPKAE